MRFFFFENDNGDFANFMSYSYVDNCNMHYKVYSTNVSIFPRRNCIFCQGEVTFVLSMVGKEANI